MQDNEYLANQTCKASKVKKVKLELFLDGTHNFATITPHAQAKPLIGNKRLKPIFPRLKERSGTLLEHHRRKSYELLLRNKRLKDSSLSLISPSRIDQFHQRNISVSFLKKFKRSANRSRSQTDNFLTISTNPSKVQSPTKECVEAYSPMYPHSFVQRARRFFHKNTHAETTKRPRIKSLYKPVTLQTTDGKVSQFFRRNVSVIRSRSKDLVNLINKRRGISPKRDNKFAWHKIATPEL